MTSQEFSVIYKRLADLYPVQFGNKEKANAIAQEVRNLSRDWFEKLVNKIIAANDPFVKLLPLIEGEKRRVSQEFSTSEQARDFEQMKQNATGMGLEAMKKQHNTPAIWDLVVTANGLRKGKGA